MVPTDTETDPLHTTDSEETLENKRLYEPGELSWKETLLARYGDLDDIEEVET